ncbi:MAG TPA: 3-deoxy-7-phosphoheptulonate synthase [Opitutaceae bacterium]|nr:3-deoxy-7-phosphoheptulonate synthase [Opitutaceae bacterium]
MHAPTSDLRIRATKPLVTPAALEAELPLDDAGAQVISNARRQIARVLSGEDDRLVVVVGPCSIHDPEAAVEYGERLAGIVERYRDTLLIVMRVYFEKPRTVTGWKGLINDPGLDQSFRINDGLRIARRLLLDVTRLGLPIGNEFLDTTLGQYYADLVAWGAIGARTVESQVHRELASGLSMPVGFKNRTDGNIQVAVDAMRSARQPHWFPTITREGVPAILETTGNDQTHLVLRGGSYGPNFSPSHIQATVELLKKHQLRPRLMVDCSHANSGKDAERQPVVAANLAEQISHGENAICAVMLESNLIGGAQEITRAPLVYGQSVTDACLSWEKTLSVLSNLAEAVEARRRKV